MLLGNSLWYLVSQSDAMSKGVLLLLLLMSVLCWTVFVAKMILFRIKQKQLASACARAQNATTMDELTSVAAGHKGSIAGYFLSKNVSFLKKVMQRGGQGSAHAVQNHIDQTIDSVMMHEESYLSLLSTSAAVAPLLGLFGTVWGLVHSFLRISEKQSADIATVAPGIAEALITTLAGLMVAIPALILYNVLSSKLRSIEHYLVRLADCLESVIHASNH